MARKISEIDAEMDDVERRLLEGGHSVKAFEALTRRRRELTIERRIAEFPPHRQTEAVKVKSVPFSCLRSAE